MPCDSVTLQSVNLANAIPSVLVDALKDTDWHITEETPERISAYRYGDSLTWTNGKGLTIEAQRPERTLETVTRAYSSKAVSWAAQRAGWTVKQDTQNTLTLTRR